MASRSRSNQTTTLVRVGSKESIVTEETLRRPPRTLRRRRRRYRHIRDNNVRTRSKENNDNLTKRIEKVQKDNKKRNSSIFPRRGYRIVVDGDEEKEVLLKAKVTSCHRCRPIQQTKPPREKAWVRLSPTKRLRRLKNLWKKLTTRTRRRRLRRLNHRATKPTTRTKRLLRRRLKHPRWKLPNPKRGLLGGGVRWNSPREGEKLRRRNSPQKVPNNKFLITCRRSKLAVPFEFCGTMYQQGVLVLNRAGIWDFDMHRAMARY